jgi:hypothetical protein
MATKKRKRETTIDDLAVMINSGFNEMKESNAREHKEMRIKLNSLKQGQEDIIRSNTREHEELKLRQDEVPYRFEFVELEKRVEVLERRVV